MSKFNRDRAEQAIMEARARDYSKLEVELAEFLEQALDRDAKGQALLRMCRRVVLAARATVDSWADGFHVSPLVKSHLKQIVEDFDIQHPPGEKIGDE